MARRSKDVQCASYLCVAATTATVTVSIGLNCERGKLASLSWRPAACPTVPSPCPTAAPTDTLHCCCLLRLAACSSCLLSLSLCLCLSPLPAAALVVRFAAVAAAASWPYKISEAINAAHLTSSSRLFPLPAGCRAHCALCPVPVAAARAEPRAPYPLMPPNVF